MVNSGTSLGDLAEKVNLGANPRDLAKRVNSGTNPGDLAERVNSGTNPGDLAERVNSGTNPMDLAEKRLLKEARVRARKMDDELLQVVKALENARAELPRQSVDHYKESVGFKEGLKRMS
ncbi:hypothetical protein BHE74_00046605 [Ensete ventricosum]|nr:hypothetical protein BHE74_00046605 [Ensete ventricosum]